MAFIKLSELPEPVTPIIINEKDISYICESPDGSTLIKVRDQESLINVVETEEEIVELLMEEVYELIKESKNEPNT